MTEGKTRNQKAKRKTTAIGHLSRTKVNQILEERLDYLQSDFYQTPEKLAQEQDDEQLLRRQKKRVNRRLKREKQMRRKLNLKKMLKQGMIQQPPNFVTCKAVSGILPGRKTCAVCGQPGKGRCPRCLQSFCTLRCNNIHKELRCRRFQI